MDKSYTYLYNTDNTYFSHSFVLKVIHFCCYNICALKIGLNTIKTYILFIILMSDVSKHSVRGSFGLHTNKLITIRPIRYFFLFIFVSLNPPF